MLELKHRSKVPAMHRPPHGQACWQDGSYGFDLNWAPFAVERVSSSRSGAVGSQLGVAIVPEDVLNDGTKDPAQLVLLILPAGAEGGYSAVKAIQTPLSRLFRKPFQEVLLLSFWGGVQCSLRRASRPADRVEPAQ